MNELTRVNETRIQAQPISADLITRFLAYIDAASPRTAETYIKNLKAFAKWTSAHGISTPTRDDVIAYRDMLKATKKPATVNAYMGTVRLFFQWTEREGAYPNVADRVKGVRESKDNKKDYLTTKQIKRALSLIDRDTPQGLRNYALFTLMVTCGLRDIEAARANVGDLGSVGDNTVLYVHGKGRTDKSDFIRVSEAAEIILRDYLTKAGITEPGAPIFQSLSNNSRGRRLSTRSISQIIKNILKRAGYDSDRLTAHSLRHSAVTISLLGGKTLQEAQQFARHANIATTQVYAHNLDKAGNDCSDTVSKAIFER